MWMFELILIFHAAWNGEAWARAGREMGHCIWDTKALVLLLQSYCAKLFYLVCDLWEVCEGILSLLRWKAPNLLCQD